MRFALLLVVLCATASAGGPPPPSVRVTATATSSLAKSPPTLAIDSTDASRGWCAGKDVAGETLTFVFDEAIPITKATIAASYADRVEVKTDTKTISSDLKHAEVELDGKPTKQVAIKVTAVRAGGHVCLGARFVAPSTYYYGFVYGFERAALDAVPKFAAELDAAFRHCDEAVLARSVKFPIKHEHETLVPDLAVPPPTKVATYRSAAELAKACHKADSPLQRGLAGGNDDATLADDIAHPSVERNTLLRLGDWNSHYWLLAWDANQWRVTELKTSEDGLDQPVDHIKDLVQAQLDVWKTHDTPHYSWYFAPNATMVLLWPTASVVKATDAGDALRGVVGATKQVVKDVAVGLARDRKSGWLSFTVKLTAPAAVAEFRVSEVVVRDDRQWRILTGLWSEAQANDAVNKSAKASSTPKIAPIKNPKPDDSVLGAFLTMQKGPIDATAAARKDLVVFGSGPGERTVGGAAFARPWAAAWANHLPMMGDAIAAKTPSGTTAWFVGDVALEKGKEHYLVPFRLFLVFDQSLDGSWTLVHVHIATPSP